MKNKSHAHLWYPKDILTDKRVIAMTLEQEACYRRLLDYAWIENGLDNDPALLASYCKMNGQLEAFSEIWKVIKKCFNLHRKKFRNKRQEQERKKQKLYSNKQRNASKHRWDKEKGANPTAIPRHTSGNASSQDQTSKDQLSKRSIINNKTDDLFNDADKGKLMEGIAKSTGWGMTSEATQRELNNIIKKVSEAKNIKNRMGYALTIAKELKNDSKRYQHQSA